VQHLEFVLVLNISSGVIPLQNKVCLARSRSVKRTRDDENCRVQHAREKYLRVWLADPTLRYEGIHFVLGTCASPTSRSFKSCLFFPSPEWKAAVVFWRRRLVDNQIWASLVTTRTEDIQFLETFRFNHLGLPWDGN